MKIVTSLAKKRGNCMIEGVEKYLISHLRHRKIVAIIIEPLEYLGESDLIRYTTDDVPISTDAPNECRLAIEIDIAKKVHYD